ncbi:carboxypeptidase-like regulatory domain-containing protein [Ekhidna sp.]|uniref:carboxypeptidase-like regulatory domain-containing protein n=1 Tax=Ekhidna sp. TaxID=2608089 RepID=UPI003C7C2FBB
MSFFSSPLLWLAICLLNHEPASIKGIIKDKETNEPIPFAHVVVGDVINVTNIDGEFVISTKEITDADELKISYMGYEAYYEELTEIKDYYTIYLEPSTIQLDEVVVMTGKSLMETVFDRFHLNYQMDRLHMIGYYKESMSDWNSTYYLAEGIMDIYVPSNVDKLNEALVRPIRTRKKVFREVDIINEVLGGNASDMAQSSIWRKGSFLHPKNRDNYDYQYSGYTNMGEHEVLIVDFEPINKKGNTRGKIYVDYESHAILKIEYFPILRDYAFWESVSWTEEYEKRDGIYELLSVSFDGVSTHNEYSYHALLVVNECFLIDEIPNEYRLLNSQYSFFEEASDDFSDAFWNGFNFMKLDVESAQLVRSSSKF